jgi:hypothetical protein
MKLVYRNNYIGSRAILVYKLTSDVYLIKSKCESINYLIDHNTYQIMFQTENCKVLFHITHNDEPTLVLCTTNGDHTSRTLFPKFFNDLQSRRNKSLSK